MTLLVTGRVPACIVCSVFVVFFEWVLQSRSCFHVSHIEMAFLFGSMVGLKN